MISAEPRVTMSMRKATTAVVATAEESHFSSAKSSQKSSSPSQGTAQIQLFVWRCLHEKVAAFTFLTGKPKSLGQFLHLKKLFAIYFELARDGVALYDQTLAKNFNSSWKLRKES